MSFDEKEEVIAHFIFYDLIDVLVDSSFKRFYETFIMLWINPSEVLLKGSFWGLSESSIKDPLILSLSLHMLNDTSGDKWKVTQIWTAAGYFISQFSRYFLCCTSTNTCIDELCSWYMTIVS